MLIIRQMFTIGPPPTPAVYELSMANLRQTEEYGDECEHDYLFEHYI